MIKISRSAFAHNASVLSAAAGDAGRVWAVVKSNAYGHGIDTIADWARQEGFGGFCVAAPMEALRLRALGHSQPILMLQPVSDADTAAALVRNDVALTVGHAEHLALLRQTGLAAKVHLKVDCGMHRLGFSPDELPRVLANFPAAMTLDGMFTHFPCADNTAVTQYQNAIFAECLLMALRAGHEPRIHAAASLAALTYPEARYDCIRAGIGMYGYAPGCKPVLTWSAPILQLHTLRPGEGVGYDHAFIAKRPTTLAVVGTGYGRGLMRCLGQGKGAVMIGGHRAPIVGKVCMEQIFVDVTDLPLTQIGQSVDLIGLGLWADDVAAASGTISYEVTTRLPDGPRIIVP